MAITRVLMMPSVATASARLPKIPRRRSKMVKNKRRLREASSNENAEKPIFLTAASMPSTCEGLLARTVKLEYVGLPFVACTASRKSFTCAARSASATWSGMSVRPLPKPPNPAVARCRRCTPACSIRCRSRRSEPASRAAITFCVCRIRGSRLRAEWLALHVTDVEFLANQR